MSDTSIQKWVEEKNAALQFADQLLKTAEREDWLPGGWDADEISAVVDAYRPGLSAAAVTMEEAQAQAAKAHEMLGKILQTYSGARGCVKLGRCGVESYFKECPALMEPTGPRTVYTYEGAAVRTEGIASCKGIFTAGNKI